MSGAVPLGVITPYREDLAGLITLCHDKNNECEGCPYTSECLEVYADHIAADWYQKKAEKRYHTVLGELDTILRIDLITERPDLKEILQAEGRLRRTREHGRKVGRKWTSEISQKLKTHEPN